MLGRIFKDKIAKKVMQGLTFFAFLLLVMMGVGLYYKSVSIIKANSIWQLLSSSEWSPLTGHFGFYSFILGTVYVTLLAVGISVPISLLMALFLTQNAKSWIKKIVFPVLDILAAIPSVIYGVWGILIIVPFIANVLGPYFVDYTSGYTVLAGGVVLSVMLVPLLVSLFVEIFSTIPESYKDASASLGATRWQTSRSVILRKSSSGIIASVMLAISKAFGETIAVLMVCGSVVKNPKSLFDSCYPLSVLIANNFGEMMSVPMYESALMFAALIMFIIIFIFNVISRLALQRIERSLRL
ncbi:phosphate ABC transporter permease subunit PstC [Candidatus Azobacteroides pseudotrichonymphae]|uniref:Phosphate transport system permease protein n=1 Tax=Azobacteroides pseudotrichonymphae genomovar. CFP2 TaxID=511995 RepID=B6YQR7_AZOPC|nr:phosphate ABC transporter permease subunit PstC [Candidatus Azobacteroides pseudotrichonymphae]BAG83539.1 ABC-type phosphate transporter permease component PstC [Candidatus Azobacteroides pseudotrichonymphae genomovar. CFP2]